jgi:hypothetical protein
MLLVKMVQYIVFRERLTLSLVTAKGVSTSPPFRFETGISRLPEGPEERDGKICPFRIWNCVKTGFNVAYGRVPVLHKNTFVDVFMQIEGLPLLEYLVVS